MKRLKISRSVTQSQLAWVLLVIIMLVYATEISYQTLLRYDTFKATAFDLGNMDQVLWNTIHGRLFQFTNQGADWYGPPTRLAIRRGCRAKPPASLAAAVGRTSRAAAVGSIAASVSITSRAARVAARGPDAARPFVLVTVLIGGLPSPSCRRALAVP